jgi:hypothetical protein
VQSPTAFQIALQCTALHCMQIALLMHCTQCTVRQSMQHEPSIPYKITPCWVTLIQPRRRAAVLGQPSFLRPSISSLRTTDFTFVPSFSKRVHSSLMLQKVARIGRLLKKNNPRVVPLSMSRVDGLRFGILRGQVRDFKPEAEFMNIRFR